MSYERIIGLHVIDPVSYQAYRDGMLPILARYSGKFRYDLDVERVRQPEQGVVINRLFVISFPDRKTKDAFFADPDYLAVRKRYFTPAVSSITTLAEYDEP